MIRAIAAFLTAIVIVSVAGSNAGAQAAPSTVWVQWEADGLPHARAIVHGAACPNLSAGGASVAMAERAAPGSGFADRVCDARLPANAANASVGTAKLPAIPRAPQRIAVFGDTGCRLKGTLVQACNNPAAWPFPAIAKDIAAARPDLVIHVGDYYYRESPCPRRIDCTNSPYGDNSASWAADYFVPMAPVFAVAPIINVRGNHEDCKRSALGWARYLSGLPNPVCMKHEPPAYASFENLFIGNIDDVAGVTEVLPAPAVFMADRAAFDARAATAHRESWLIAHRPPIAYLFTHENGRQPGNIDAYISGHIHLFGAYTFPGEAPQVIVGVGGDNLALQAEERTLAQLGGTTERRFGYALFLRDGNGWSIEVHDVDTLLHRRCRLERRAVSCGPALTGTR